MGLDYNYTKPVTHLFTAGYEGDSVQSFVDKLRLSNVGLVVDVRENPVSRKSGFNKNSLNDSLTSSGIGYLHMQELGTPKPLRAMLSINKNYSTFFEKYKDFLSEFQDSIDDIIELGSNENVCLVCFEHDPHLCHRRVIADLVFDRTNRRIQVVHL